jgi:hypothetical protein
MVEPNRLINGSTSADRGEYGSGPFPTRYPKVKARFVLVAFRRSKEDSQQS